MNLQKFKKDFVAFYKKLNFLAKCEREINENKLRLYALIESKLKNDC